MTTAISLNNRCNNSTVKSYNIKRARILILATSSQLSRIAAVANKISKYLFHQSSPRVAHLTRQALLVMSFFIPRYMLGNVVTLKTA